MPSSILFNGRSTSRPGVYAKVVNNLGAAALPATGNLAVVINECFLDLDHRYQAVKPVTELLEYARILIQNVVWAAMNVPWPEAEDLHIYRVIDNAIEVYTMVIYAPLRTEMIMANHNAQVLQRTWRRCITDPEHPACRRRLEYEFREM